MLNKNILFLFIIFFKVLEKNKQAQTESIITLTIKMGTIKFITQMILV